MRSPVSLVVPALALAVAACTAASTDPADPGETGSDVSTGALPLKLDARSLTQALNSRGIKTKSDALAILPRELRQRFVLVKNTGALGVSSPDRPRVIHFLEDGRFILASTGHKIDEDVTANSLEILAEDDITHTYRTHTITITPENGAVLTEDDQRCVGCHGSPARPIWGSYPNWPAAYGAHEDNFSAEEHTQFDGFNAMSKADPDYKHLEILPYSTGYLLPTPYGFANTQFGSAIGDRYAFQLAERIEQSANHDKLVNALIATSLDCGLSSSTDRFVDTLYSANKPAAETKYPAKRTASKIYRLLGVEPTTDMRVENPVISPPEGEWEIGLNPYDVGSDYLTRAVTFPLFAKLVKADAKLGELYASKMSVIDSLVKLTVRGDVPNLEKLTRESTPTYFDANVPGFFTLIHQPVMEGEHKKSAVCDRLAELQQAAQN